MENKKISTNKFMIVSAIMLVAATILGLVVAYGWAVNVYSENEIVDINALSGITLNYLDCDSSDVSSCADISKDLAPGESVDKVFEVTNTTPRDISFNLYFKELYNSFYEDDLVYTLKNVTTNEVLVPETPVRFSELKLYDLILKRDITIGGNATHKYKLTIKFLNKDENQNYNKDASYFIKLSIRKYTKEGIVPKIVASITDNTPLPADESIKTGTPDFSKSSPVATEYMEYHADYTDEMDVSGFNQYTSGEIEYADSYTFDSKTGLFTFVNPKMCVYSECFDALIGKYTTYPYDWGDENIKLSQIAKIKPYTDGQKVKFSSIYGEYKTYEANDGIYSMEDDYGTSFYFRGTGQNNYVKFAGFYWRIIRVNGDGSVRIMYNGTEAHPVGELSEDQTAFNSPFNEKWGDAKYVGYMYGPSGEAASTSKEEAQANTESSTIKTNLENWYVENIKSKNLDQYVADAVFCYDRSTPGSSVTGVENDTGLGYGRNFTIYGSSSRLVDFNNYSQKENANPAFTCSNKNDAFTVSDIEKGNGATSEKVGLITADELVAAGNIYNKSNRYNYLATGPWIWSGSPYNYNGYASVFVVNYDYLYYNNVSYTRGAVVPVINLSAEYAKNLIGSGEIGDEYRNPNTD